MNENTRTITEQLKDPFKPELIHWRVGATNAKALSNSTILSDIASILEYSLSLPSMIT